MTISPEQAKWCEETFGVIVGNVEQAIRGKTHVIELVLATALAGGHVLLEDVPGTGKTALARALGQTIKGTTSRIQFTPDLLPGDITGVSVFDQKKGTWVFHAGPIFSNVVLADEINRASPKTQAALLEVMEEGNVTIDGVTREVGRPFLVMATQNPVEQAGTYRLPEAQLDRFMIRTSVGYPDKAAMLEILDGFSSGATIVPGIVDLERVLELIEVSKKTYVNPVLSDYVMRIVEGTRLASEVRLGVSVRGAIAMTRLMKTWAAMHGRTFVTPDDIRDLATPVFAHRLVMEPEAEFDGVTAVDVVGQVVLDTPPPTENGAG